MSEAHRLSYEGDLALIDTLLKMLRAEGLTADCDDPRLSAGPPGHLGDDEAIGVLAVGGHETASADIARVIATFTSRFRGQAEVHDDGAMPTGHQVSYRGDPALLEEFVELLSREGLEVSDPEEDCGRPSIDQLDTGHGDTAPIVIRILGWGDINAAVSAAVAVFDVRFPGRATIRD